MTVELPPTQPGAAMILGADAKLADALVVALSENGVSPVTDRQDAGISAFIYVAAAAHQGIGSASAEDFSTGVGGALKAAFRDLKRGVAAIRAGGSGGAVVIIAPPADGRRAFDAVRQGLRLLVKSAALELGPEGIRVNIVLPDAGESPLGGRCAANDIAKAAAFAVSDQSRFMTGADLVVDGGRMAL